MCQLSTRISRSDSPLVSIITPTCCRQDLLPLAYSCVISQDWPHFEWLILDNSPEKASFFRSIRDPRIIYHHDATSLSVGMKRNILAAQASGEYIAHFDDDDYYAPNYISEVLSSLRHNNADATKLTGMFIYDARYHNFFYWDQMKRAERQYICKPNFPFSSRVGDTEKAFIKHRLGFGFSYVYKRKLWDDIGFPDVNFAEDLCFMAEATAKHSVLLNQDRIGMCLHVIHQTNLSGCFPQFMLPKFLAHSIFSRAHQYLKGVEDRHKEMQKDILTK
jgi:glycosyltransferase involved in cell wall biosynthesis